MTQWNNGHVVIGDYHLWFDSNGMLRYKSSAPGSDTDGMSVTPGVALRAGKFSIPPLTQSNVAIALNSLRVYRLRVSKTTTFDRAALYIPGSGAGSTVRLGIYADDGNNYPGSLVAELGSGDSTSAGTVSLTINQALLAGTYWAGAVSQGGTAPTVNANTGAAEGIVASSATEAAQSLCGYEMTGVTAALPGTFTVTAPVQNTHRVLLRAADKVQASPHCSPGELGCVPRCIGRDNGERDGEPRPLPIVHSGRMAHPLSNWPVPQIRSVRDGTEREEWNQSSTWKSLPPHSE